MQAQLVVRLDYYRKICQNRFRHIVWKLFQAPPNELVVAFNNYWNNEWFTFEFFVEVVCE